MPPRPTSETAHANFARALNTLQREARKLPAGDFHDSVDEAIRRLTEQKREVIVMDQQREELAEMRERAFPDQK